MTEVTADTGVETTIPEETPRAPVSAYDPADWREVPRGFYAIPVWDWSKFGDECGMHEDDPAPVLELLGFELFERKIPRTRKGGRGPGKVRDELAIGRRVARCVSRRLWAGTDHETLITPWDRLREECHGDRWSCEHDIRRDGDTSPVCRCWSCQKHPDREWVASWVAVPNQREAYINHVAAVILDGIKNHGDVYSKLYGRLTGSCGRCGRLLTDPTSKLIGVGPDCRGYR